jgi:hypothetical protein
MTLRIVNQKKAQSALEYLWVYGFGILAVIFTITIAWQFGAFSRPAPEESTPGIKGFSQLVVEDFRAYENFLNLSIKNNAPDVVRITKINASIEYEINCTFSESFVDMNPGEEVTFQLNCDKLDEKYYPGSYYKAHVLISYINMRTNNLHQSLGYIWSIIE